uniref:Uncharacterized protein n=1 Tax=Glossina pallidipes TaxID=7398 RepID=A0A1A9ZCR3_GLOPL
MHALEEWHSELITHSGLQAGGGPIYSGKQEHIASPLISRHWPFGPQAYVQTSSHNSYTDLQRKPEGFSPLARHSEFAPQGDGWQGSFSLFDNSGKTKDNENFKLE